MGTELLFQVIQCKADFILIAITVVPTIIRAGSTIISTGGATDHLTNASTTTSIN
jgi:hypothetical protein